MILNWFKTIFKKKKTHSFIHQEDRDITNLITFLWSKVETSRNASVLKTQVDFFSKSSFEDKIELLPSLYLILEEYLTEKNTIYKYTKRQIRDKISSDYRFIYTYSNCEPIFQDLKKQELTLCRIFLIKILEKSAELVGEFNDVNIIYIKRHLENSNYFENENLIKQKKRLLDFSNQIFTKIKDSLGENAIANIYLIVYKKHFEAYHLLESFTTTLHVIPEDIFSKELTNFPSKQQMQKMLQKQLYSLEEINEKLTKEIIERKKIEEDLKHSEHLKTRILDTAMDGIILVDETGIVLDWNKKAEKILQVKKEETIGHSIYPLVPYKLRQELKNSFNSYIEKGEGQLINKRVETSVPLRNRSIVYVELTIIAIKTKEGYLFNAFFRDITNKRIIENEIREAKVFAEKSAKAKSIFLSNMSHEIRTPLNVILGLTSILQKSDFTDPKIDRTNLDGIQFSAENLLVLINDILDFSKIEAGKLTLHKTDFNIHELITNLSRGFKIKADEKGLTYNINIDNSLPKFIIGDQFRLNQILTNLLGNAIKFTHKGEVNITVNVEKKDPDTITTNFSIIDTGVGIPEDKLHNIFQSFYQVHEPGKYKIEGTGLGLSISKQLIELQGGILKVKSEPNIGSCFEFSITYNRSKLTSSTFIDHKTRTIDKSHNISGMNVLIVEDNKMNQFFIKQLFTNWNINTDIAENGKVALQKLDDKLYDLILMDMHMPVMDGPEATLLIRNSHNTKINTIPIIACSADVFPESKKIAIESGMNFFLTKPISEKALEEILYSLTVFTSKETKKIEKTKKYERHSKNEMIPSQERCCDFSILNQTFENDKKIIQSVLQIFLDETPQDYTSLQSAVKQYDLAITQQKAHKLKSSFKTLGIKQAILLQKIEHAAKEGRDHEYFLQLINSIDNAYPKIITEIKTKIKELTLNSKK
ncbi:ATP-binding protein [Aquimarina sp. RZ0]|uniref:PAS domain-containing hybrid sensor histidine kinase/response regulator n=1 Tax=Aquimarina sp. RZ0 TaxID=2607730 RepID=UPI0011F3EDB8|nr:ATP-binding protein [Aquimarina sp. RZ0]KAA1247809.1 response regulator [Aquimarina sp. RZ0]